MTSSGCYKKLRTANGINKRRQSSRVGVPDWVLLSHIGTHVEQLKDKLIVTGPHTMVATISASIYRIRSADERENVTNRARL